MNYERTHRTAFHGMALPTSSLSICEDADMVPVDTALHELRDLFKDLLLS